VGPATSTFLFSCSLNKTSNQFHFQQPIQSVEAQLSCRHTHQADNETTLKTRSIRFGAAAPRCNSHSPTELSSLAGLSFAITRQTADSSTSGLTLAHHLSARTSRTKFRSEIFTLPVPEANHVSLRLVNDSAAVPLSPRRRQVSSSPKESPPALAERPYD
jgi:hypothetical protein